jgi:GNAT superfamily N-acetyltransferase
MELAIRNIQPGDLDALFELVERFATSFRPERLAFEESAHALLAQEDAWLGGAESAGRLIGYCLGFDHLTFYANGRVAWIEEIMVAETCRRQGVGSALMVGFEGWARSRGSRLIGLATRRAAPFYDALGYEASATYFRRIL